MEPRPRLRLRRSPPPPPPQNGAGDPDGDDRISALPEDMLLQVLVRLRCARAAARTGLLSRRWRGLWSRLPGLTFRDIAAGGIKSALSRVAPRTTVSLLEIHLSSSASSAECKLDDARAKSLLRATARLSPEEIVFILPKFPVLKPGRAVTIVLPCFCRTTMIELDTRFLPIMPPPAGELPVLETLSISGKIVDVSALLDRCPRLRVFRITFRDVEPGSLEAELTTLEAAAALGLAVSHLGIEFYHIGRRHSVDDARFHSLLRAAARLSPWEILFTSRFLWEGLEADLPCFHRTTSIEMNLYGAAIRFTQLLAGEFSALERLTLNGCTITHLSTMIIRCPRLRVLKVAANKSARDVKIHSVSLEELELRVLHYAEMECPSIHIVTPILKQLKLSAYGKTNHGVFISAPVVEKLLCCHTYTPLARIFGFWWLQNMKLETIKSYKHKDGVLINDEEEGVCSHLPRAHALSMVISSDFHSGDALDFEPEMERLPVTDFYVLELYFNTKGHVFGACVLRLLRMHRIRTSALKLKIVLPWLLEMPQASQCLGKCPCDEPRDWRSQSTSLTRLEEVEIKNFRGGVHEIDFMTLILGWAPMLKRMIIKLAFDVKWSEMGGCATTIYNICSAYPYVNCFVYRYSGEKLNTPLA